MERLRSLRKPITRGSGVTPAEKHLARLCDRTFLSLWSYPAPHRDDGRRSGRGHGRELCDLLVVCGQHVVVFSDKDVSFLSATPLATAWPRWFRAAIWEGARQAWGARNWILRFPEKVYIDKSCEQPFPLAIPREDARVHLVVVAHGATDAIRRHFGEGGSLVLDMARAGRAAHVEPFIVGDLDPARPFVHVLDEESLDLVMGTRDTVTDFLAYLERRERFLRGPVMISATGEEELLAIYLRKLNDHGEHDFVFDWGGIQGRPDRLHIDAGYWESFSVSDQRAKQLEADKVSYTWDRLIEKFSRHALRGTQYAATSREISDTERILRFMASETRHARRDLGAQLVEMLRTTPITHKRVRVSKRSVPGWPVYVFLLFPRREGVEYDEYRRVRASYLGSCCMVARLLNPDAMDIVGIATETGWQNETRSEDAAFLDGRIWNEHDEQEARELQKDLRILTEYNVVQSSSKEFPE